MRRRCSGPPPYPRPPRTTAMSFRHSRSLRLSLATLPPSQPLPLPLRIRPSSSGPTHSMRHSVAAASPSATPSIWTKWNGSGDARMQASSGALSCRRHSCSHSCSHSISHSCRHSHLPSHSINRTCRNRPVPSHSPSPGSSTI